MGFLAAALTCALGLSGLFIADFGRAGRSGAEDNVPVASDACGREGLRVGEVVACADAGRSYRSFSRFLASIASLTEGRVAAVVLFEKTLREPLLTCVAAWLLSGFEACCNN